MEELKTRIRHVPDFPKAGILFYDITTLLQDAAGFRMAIDSLALPFKDRGIDIKHLRWVADPVTRAGPSRCPSADW